MLIFLAYEPFDTSYSASVKGAVGLNGEKIIKNFLPVVLLLDILPICRQNIKTPFTLITGAIDQ